MHEVNESKGGGTAAMLSRTKLFSDNGTESHILTFDYNLDYNDMSTRFKDYKKMHRRSKIMNIHDFYRDKNTNDFNYNGIDSQFETNTSDVDTVYLDKTTEQQKEYFFCDGELIKAKVYDELGEIKYIDYYDRDEHVKDRFEICNNKIHRKIKYHSVTKNILSERLYTEDGFCYLTRYFNPETKNAKDIFLYDRGERTPKYFKSNKEFASYWFRELCILDIAESIQPIIIADGQGSLSRVLGVPKTLAKRFYILHKNHFQRPYKPGSPIVQMYEYVFENFKYLDGFIVLTEKQKQDIIKQYGDTGNIYVLPNYSQIEGISTTTKKPYQVLLASRLAKTKAIDKTIEMFQYVVQVEPKAILKIYGDGPEKKTLENLIKESGLEKNVFMMGHSRNVQQEMQKSIVTVLTSETEGFGLVIAESLLRETSAVSLDCNYGPSDIIADGVDGYVVNDLNDMAEKVLYLLRNEGIAKKMGRKGRKNMIRKYSSEIIFKKWDSLF